MSPEPQIKGKFYTMDTLELYEKYSPMMTKYAFRLCRDRSLANDLVSDVFLALLEGNQPTSNVKAYLFTSVYNRFITWHRSRSQVSLSPHIATERDVTANTAEFRILLNKVIAASKYLSRNRRHVLMLQMEGVSDEESAKLLKTRISNVRNLRARALKDMRSKCVSV